MGRIQSGGWPMALKLRGNAWYLKKTVRINGVSKVKEFPLKVYGGEANRKHAEKEAAKLAKDVNRANAAAGVFEEFGIEKRAPKVAAAPTLSAFWKQVQDFYPGDRDRRVMAVWLELPRDYTTTWGATALDAFTRSDCESAMTLRRKQYRRTRSGKITTAKVSEATVRRDVRTMKAVFARAVVDRILTHSPWAGIKLGGDQSRQRLLLPEEEAKLCAELIPRHSRWVQFVLETGLRLEGARDLRDDLVRQVNGVWQAHVSEKSARHHDVCAVCGRQGRKCREVPLMKRAQAIVKDQRDADGQLWAGLDGMASIQKALAHAARRAKIHRVSPHDLRHTFGHRWLTRGGSVDDLSFILGHSDSRITRKHYAHLLNEDLAAKMRAVMEPVIDQGATNKGDKRLRRA
jgi:integrase